GVAERKELIARCTSDLPSVEVHSFSGLLVDFMRRVNATVVVRGIRAVSDYEYELQMALMNRELSTSVETIFMLPAVEYTYVSSRLVKEVFRLGGNVAHLVPARKQAPSYWRERLANVLTHCADRRHRARGRR